MIQPPLLMMKVDIINNNFDVNGPCLLGDSKKPGLNVIINHLAGTLKHQWDPRCERMSLKKYVQTVLLPEDRYDKTIQARQEQAIEFHYNQLKNLKHPLYEKAMKAMQEGKIEEFVNELKQSKVPVDRKVMQEAMEAAQTKDFGGFLNQLGQLEHPVWVKAQLLQQQLEAKYLDENKKIKFKLLPSVKKYIDRAQKASSYYSSNSLQTFGQDGDTAGKEFTDKCGVRMTPGAKMTSEGLQFFNSDKQVGETITGLDILETCVTFNPIVRHSFENWRDNKYRGISGKIIYCTKDALFRKENSPLDGRSIVTVFFDDHFEKRKTRNEDRAKEKEDGADPTKENII